MKYLFIDTNIYIQCCLLELEGDDLNTLKELHDLLDRQKIKLLLPEVVELELERGLENKIEGLKLKIGKIKELINKDNFDKRVKADLVKKLNDCIKDREKNTKRVKEELQKIFASRNTIKIKIIQNNLLNSYRMFLLGKKPYNSKLKGEIQPDCIIIDLLQKFFQKKDYKLYFCSQNKDDFTQNPNKKGINLVIHKDISEKFEHIKYYQNLFELLNSEFSGKYSQKSIEKLKEKEKETPLFDRLEAISISPGCFVGPDSYRNGLQTEVAPLVTASGVNFENFRKGKVSSLEKGVVYCSYCAQGGSPVAPGDICPICGNFKNL